MAIFHSDRLKKTKQKKQKKHRPTWHDPEPLASTISVLLQIILSVICPCPWYALWQSSRLATNGDLTCWSFVDVGPGFAYIMIQEERTCNVFSLPIVLSEIKIKIIWTTKTRRYCIYRYKWYKHIGIPAAMTYSIHPTACLRLKRAYEPGLWTMRMPRSYFSREALSLVWEKSHSHILVTAMFISTVWQYFCIGFCTGMTIHALWLVNRQDFDLDL